MVTSGHNGKRRLLKAFCLLIIIGLLAAGGWLAYNKHHSTAKTLAPAQRQNIPLLKIGVEQGSYGALYPDMSDTEYSFLTNAQMFEGLVRYENKSQIVPDLATRWTNPDSKTWLFTIKSGVKFHDGHTLSANDVKYSLDTVIASDSDLAQTFASSIASVDVVGSNQVKITTSTPDPTLLNKLSFLYVIDANLPKGDEPSLAGTGPYEIKPGTTPTDTNVQMVAFDGYHGGRPTTRALQFGSASDGPSLVADYKAGKFNVIGPVSPSDVKSAGSAKQFIVNEADISFIGFNTVQPGPAQNKLVREAIRYAVNAAAIGKAYGQEVTPESQLIPPSIPGYNPAITPYKQDIAKAKQLLAQAGYPNGLTLRFSTGDTAGKLAAITDELKQAGITLTVDEHSDFDEFISYFSAGKAEMYDVAYSSDTLDGLDIYTTTLPAANYNNAQFNDLVSQASTTNDPAKRLKILQNIAVVINGDIPVVPLYSTSNIWLTDKQYNLRQDLPSAGTSVYFYQAYQ